MLSAFRKFCTMIRVRPVSALEDNYMYIVYNDKTNQAFVVDPVEPEKIIHVAEEMKVSIVAALITHHHWDHAGGTPKFRELLGKDVAPIYGGDDRIEHMDNHVAHDQVLELAGLKVRCLSTPCHTRGHICYHVTTDDDSSGVVLTGDTLFVAGCGKFFEGTADQMQHNLNVVLAGLQDVTKVFAGHEYTASNLKFARHVEPDNAEITKKLNWAIECGKRGEPTVPSTIAEEKATNPFMRVTSTAIQTALSTTDPVEVMKKLREAKNTFKAAL